MSKKRLVFNNKYYINDKEVTEKEFNSDKFNDAFNQLTLDINKVTESLTHFCKVLKVLKEHQKRGK